MRTCSTRPSQLSSESSHELFHNGGSKTFKTPRAKALMHGLGSKTCRQKR